MLNLLTCSMARVLFAKSDLLSHSVSQLVSQSVLAVFLEFMGELVDLKSFANCFA